MIDTEKGRLELSRFTVDMVVRLALIAGVVYVSFLLLRPVLPILLWAVILAVAVFPLYAPLRQRMRLPAWLAATLLSFLLLALLLAPVALLSVSAIETLDSYAHLLMQGNHLLPPPPESVRDWPLIGQRLHEFWYAAASDTHTFLTSHVGQIASLGRWVGEIAAGVAVEVLQFALAVVVAGVLLGYSERLTAAGRQPCRPHRRCARTPLRRDRRRHHPQCLAGRDRRGAAAVGAARARHAGCARAVRRRHHLCLPGAGDRAGRAQRHHDPGDHLDVDRDAGAARGAVHRLQTRR